MAYSKGKLKSVEAMLALRGDIPVDLHINMLDFAGKTVTITSADSGDTDDIMVSLKEDNGEYTWCVELFSEFPENLKSHIVFLSAEIDCNDRVRIDKDGDVHVGCQLVTFTDLTNIYNEAVRVKKLNIPKPRRKKKVSKKK